jgi:hypothetical protein
VRGVILVSLETDLTRTCFSVSSDDKLVLFLFPGIPTGDPAIVAFYDKRIYKKLRLKELSLSDPINYCSHVEQLTFNCHKGGGAYHGTVVYFVIFRCCFFP